MRRGRLRLVASMLVAALLTAERTAWAGTVVPLKEFLAARRGRGEEVLVELRDGRRVGGAVGRVKRSEFLVLDGGGANGRAVRYADVTAVVDPATGERVAVQTIQPKLKQPSVRTLIFVGAALAAFIVCVSVALSGT